MEFTRLFDVTYFQLEHYPREDMLGAKQDEEWVKYSTRTVVDRVNQVSRCMLQWGVKVKENVAIISENRPEWNFVDLGMLQVGAVNVPLYPTMRAEDYEFIFNQAEIRLAFVSSKRLHRILDRLRPQLPHLQQIYTFDEVEGADHYDRFLELDQQDRQPDVEELMRKVKAEDVATIIYTSGTTGTPKGVMLTHTNVVSNVVSVSTCIPITDEHCTLSSLPLCHIFERMVTYLFMYVGAGIYYAEGMEKLGDNLREVRPQYFSTVPRLLEKVYEKIHDKMKDLNPVKQKIFHWAIELGDQYEGEGSGSLWYRTQLVMADKLVFRKWREALGGRVCGIYTGAAALPSRLGRIFSAAGIPIKEGYGQTETSPVISVNRYGDDGTKFGTIGKVIPGVEVKLDKDGEILVKGPNVMKGYYKQPDATAEVFDEEGWLHTGDVGEFDGDFLKITDRKKMLFKTSGGKYVAPQVIENKFKEDFFVEQVMVVGANMKYVSALIVPAFSKLEQWAEEEGLQWQTREELLEAPEVQKRYRKIRDKVNRELSNTEKVKRFTLLPKEFTIESGEMTPTLKLKRKVIEDRLEELIHSMQPHEKN